MFTEEPYPYEITSPVREAEYSTKFATGHDSEPVPSNPQPHSLFPENLSPYEITNPVTEAEFSTKFATGHDSEPVPSNH